MFKSRTKFSDFLRKNGLYITVAVCIAVVGTLAYLAVSTGTANKEEGQNVQKQEAPNLQQELNASRSPAPTLTPMPSVSPAPSASATWPTQTQSSQTSTSGGRQASATLVMPVDGEIIKEFSGDTLVFNDTLNMWMTHNGIDIAAENGAEVKAAMAGTISQVTFDDSMGKVVTIEHSGKTATLYAGLSDVTVKEGDKINAGQVIGKCGAPGFEAKAGPHLHFEYSVNGERKDPANFLKK